MHDNDKRDYQVEITSTWYCFTPPLLPVLREYQRQDL